MRMIQVFLEGSTTADLHEELVSYEFSGPFLRIRFKEEGETQKLATHIYSNASIREVRIWDEDDI